MRAHTANDVPETGSDPGGLVVVHPGAEDLPEVLVAALVDQVQVDLAERRQEPVGVVLLHGRAVPRHQQAVVGHVGGRQDAGEDTLVLVLERGLGPVTARGVAPADDDRGGERTQGPHGDGPGVRVGTQDVVRVAVLAGDELVDLQRGTGPGRVGRGLAGRRERES